MTQQSNEALWAAAEMANQQFGQWMPQRWVELFIAALTAPGATTKSDGGEVITAEQMDAIEKAAVAGRPLTDPDWKHDNNWTAAAGVTCDRCDHEWDVTLSLRPTLASLEGDAVERVKALARRFWSIHPSTIAAMNLTREEFYAREMMALLATGLGPDEAAVRADNTANLISIIADIREKTGLGGKPMLNELADAIVAEMDRRVADEREKMRNSINTRLNDVLCEMRPDYDDSVTGFNEAWDVVRKTFDAAAIRATGEK